MNPPRILIIRLSSIGDILLATPLIRWVRKAYPDAQLDFAVKEDFTDLLSENPQLDNLRILKNPHHFSSLKALKTEIHRQNYDIIIDIHSNFRSFYLGFNSGGRVFRWKPPRVRRALLLRFKKNLLKNEPQVPLRYLSAVKNLNITDDGEGLEFFISQEGEEKCGKFFRENGLSDRKIIAIAPGAKWFTKRWLPERYIEVCRKVIEDLKSSLIFLGDSGEYDLCHRICSNVSGSAFNLAGRSSFAFAAAIMQRSMLFLGSDSGLGHLAAAVKTPSVIIFGPTVKEFGFFPFRNRSVVVEKDLYCRPCSHIGSDKCPEGHFRCMAEISVEEVFQAVSSLLSTSD